MGGDWPRRWPQGTRTHAGDHAQSWRRDLCLLSTWDVTRIFVYTIIQNIQNMKYTKYRIVKFIKYKKYNIYKICIMELIQH